ncbi:histidine kinase [Nonomuraea dietziae]|uniref:histidine kinase n=1 Tax=Nonomuraea dietziae TaxID=65515 RepID=UPI003434244C
MLSRGGGCSQDRGASPCGRILLTVRPPRSWALAAGFLAAQAPPIGLTSRDLPAVLYAIFAALAVALFVYGLSRLSGLVTALEAARRSLARNAVARERDRLARDLHDVLGFSLSAVVLRGEPAARLNERRGTLRVHFNN